MTVLEEGFEGATARNRGRWASFVAFRLVAGGCVVVTRSAVSRPQSSPITCPLSAMEPGNKSVLLSQRKEGQFDTPSVAILRISSPPSASFANQF